MSSVCLSVRYFSAGIALALGQSSSVISLKNYTFLKRQLYHLVKNQKMSSLFSWQYEISYLLFYDDIGWTKLLVSHTS
jgi:hypothetical protein